MNTPKKSTRTKPISASKQLAKFAGIGDNVTFKMALGFNDLSYLTSLNEEVLKMYFPQGLMGRNTFSWPAGEYYHLSEATINLAVSAYCLQFPEPVMTVDDFILKFVLHQDKCDKFLPWLVEVVNEAQKNPLILKLALL